MKAAPKGPNQNSHGRSPWIGEGDSIFDFLPVGFTHGYGYCSPSGNERRKAKAFLRNEPRTRELTGGPRYQFNPSLN